MENSFFNFKLANTKRLRFTHLRLLVISTFLLFTGQIVMAQKVPANCPGNSALYTANFEDASTKTAADAKIRISGAIGGNDRIAYNQGTTFTGGVSFSTAVKYSTLTNGYLTGPFSNPTLPAGQPYTFRVYTADTTCYADFTLTQPYVNFSTTPLFPDILVTSSATPNSGIGVGSTSVVVITVKNEGDTTATNVTEAIGIPTSLTLTGTPVATGGTYNTGTKIWTIPSITKGTSYTLTFTVTIAQEGVSFVTANTNTENDPYGTSIDKDSNPSLTPAGEDDETSACISTPFTYCNNDTYKISVPNYYTGFKWVWTPTGGSAVNLSIGGTTNSGGAVMNTTDNSLTVTTTGTISYTYTVGTCTVSGCCPITIIPGTKPTLIPPTIPNQTLCSSAAFAAIGPVLLTTPADTALTGSKVKYQWYTVVGSTYTAIAGQNTNTLSAAAIAAAVPANGTLIKFELKAYRGSHANCRDSTSFTLKINQVPTTPAQPTTPFVACQYGPSMTLAPTGVTGLLKWYQDATTTAFTTAAPIITTSAAGSGHWFVTQTDGNTCESARADIPWTVNAAPATPTVAPLVYCQNQTGIPALTAIGISNTPNWYSSTGVSTAAPIPVTTAAGLQFFYVSQTDAKGCESIKATLTVTVKPQPVAALLTLDATCNAGVAQSNAKIYLTRFKSDDKVTWNPGATYNSATALPAGGFTPPTTAPNIGLVIGTLANPTAATDSYTVRITGANSCTIDRVATITKANCNCNATCEPATILKTN